MDRHHVRMVQSHADFDLAEEELSVLRVAEIAGMQGLQRDDAAS